MQTEYIQFITDLKRNIVQSRYVAARLVNKEQLMLYFKTGRMLSEKIAAEKWGAKIVEQIAIDLQKQLPGLRGFSYRNIMKMKQLYEIYSPFPFLPSSTAELGPRVKKEYFEPTEASLKIPAEAFFGISFTHHILLLNKCRSTEERIFYIEQAASQFWSVVVLEHHIEANLYANQGKLPNNFNKTLPGELKPTALQVFRDEYLMDFITPLDTEDERVFEEKVVADIKNFTLRMGKGFSFIGNQFRIEIGGEEFFM